MTFTIIDKGRNIVRAIGNIDLSNSHEFDAVLDEAFAASPKGFVIDLSESTYIDSAGIQAIIRAYRKVQGTDGELALVITSTSMKRLFSIVRLDTLSGLSMHEDIASAEQAINRRLAA